MTIRLLRCESSFWQTTSLLIVSGEAAIAIDPGVSLDEVDGIRDTAAQHGARVSHILVTHADWDHVTGIGAFPEAEVSMGSLAAARIDSGNPAASIAERAEEHALDATRPPRCDRVLAPGRAAAVGPLTVETLGVPGHTADGVAYRIRAVDLLAVGDHLSPIEFPFVYDSTAAYRATLAALADVLRSDPPRVVAPGHGPLLSNAEALAIAEADLAYLHALRRTAAAALASGATAAAAAAAAAAVDPPRADVDEIRHARSLNGEAQVAELLAC